MKSNTRDRALKILAKHIEDQSRREMTGWPPGCNGLFYQIHRPKASTEAPLPNARSKSHRAK